MEQNMKSIFVIAWIVLLTPGIFAQSGDPDRKVMDSLTGNQFLMICDSTSSNVNVQSNLLLCRSYLNGLFQGAYWTAWYAVKSGIGGYVECSPTRGNVTNQQVLDVVLKYLRDDPARRDGPIGMLAYEAIQE